MSLASRMQDLVRPRSATTPRARFDSALKNAGPLIGLVAVYIFFCFWAGEPFYSAFNRVTTLTQSVIVTAGALGMTLVIISGGIDLSVGSVIALSTVVVARLLEAGVPPLLAAATGVLVGGLCGLTNGLLITRLKLVPFIITLGTLLVFRGAATGLAHEQKIDAPSPGSTTCSPSSPSRPGSSSPLGSGSPCCLRLPSPCCCATPFSDATSPPSDRAKTRPVSAEFASSRSRPASICSRACSQDSLV